MSDKNVVRLPFSNLSAGKRNTIKGLDKYKVDGDVNIQEEARKYSLLAIYTLAEICEDGETDTVRVNAANSLLDRGFGKPQQSIDLTKPTPGKAIDDQMSDDEAAEAYAATLNS